MLNLHALSKSFGALTVLNKLDLAVPEGEVLGIIGPNGAGKTTLFNLIAGVQSPSGGRITFEGRDLAGVKVWDRCRLGIGRTYQVPRPFGNMTVFENVLAAALHGGGLTMSNASRRAVEVLSTVELDHRIETLAGDLSLLDLKRLELAKALGSNPRLLLLDEIAGGLTDAECDSLLEIIGAVRGRGATVVWIEHVIHALRRVVDRIAVLHGGAIIASGTPAEVLQDAQVKQVYLGVAE